MIGIAVGSQELKVVRIVGMDSESGKPAFEVVKLLYDAEGIKRILGILSSNGESGILIAGNHKWAGPLAYTLLEHSQQVQYLPAPGKARGQRLPNIAMLKGALIRGEKGRPFLHKASNPSVEEEVPQRWRELQSEYQKSSDDLRRAKNRALDCLVFVFFELRRMGTRLWKPKFRKLLVQQQWKEFAKYGFNFEESVSRNVPADERERESVKLREQLNVLAQIESQFEDIREQITKEVGNHPVVVAYRGSFSVQLVVIAVGWKQWGPGANHGGGFRRLRSYCGLALTQIDKKGRARISQKRPAIRGALFCARATKRGKELIRAAAERRGQAKITNRVKTIEIVLKDIWRILEAMYAPVLQGAP